MGVDREKEIEAAVQELAKEGRRRSPGPPTTEELWAYARGELEPKEQDRIEELLAHYPESVRELLEMAAFPYQGDPKDPDYLTDEELDEDWSALQAHLKLEAPAPLASPASAPAKFASIPLAAVVVLAAVLSVLLFQQMKQASLPQVNAVDWELLPDDRRQGVPQDFAVQLPADASHYFLILTTVGAGEYADYRVEIVPVGDGQEKPIWTRSGLRRNSDDTFSLWLPRSFLEAGTYRLKLVGVDPDGETPLATYTVQL